MKILIYLLLGCLALPILFGVSCYYGFFKPQEEERLAKIKREEEERLAKKKRLLNHRPFKGSINRRSKYDKREP